MNLYLESSAALRDLLEGDEAQAIRALLGKAQLVATSRLTLSEVGRVLARLRVLDPQAAARASVRESEFESETELWVVQPVDEPIWERCRRPFPAEPVRLLDAVHLATIEKLGGLLPGLTILSTDERVRRNASALGFDVRP
ncbi:MAG: PIN domain-containing protein [Myxococcota bacterium]